MTSTLAYRTRRPYFITPEELTTDGSTPATMRITRATAKHLPVILGLIDEAAVWLRSKDTDQWSEPWPSRAERDKRVARGLAGGKTWMVWDDEKPAGTVTIATAANPAVWPEWACDSSERAVYVHRLITARSYAGWGLGAEMIDWAGLSAARQYGAESIRIDVWTGNQALHDYYAKRGFLACGFCADPEYPSGALFQKPTADIRPSRAPLFPHRDVWLA